MLKNSIWCIIIPIAAVVNDAFRSMNLRCISFLFLCSSCLAEGVHGNSKFLKSTPSESFIYKSKKAQTSIASRDKSGLSFLELKDKAHVGIKSSVQPNVGISEVFTLETVNGEVITNVDVIDVAKLIFFFSGKSYDESVAKMMFPAIIASLENDRLREQCARLFAIKVSDDDVSKEIAKLARLNGISEQELEKRFMTSGMSIKVLRRHIKSRLIFQAVSQFLSDESKISKSDLEVARQEQRALIASKRYYLTEIFRHDKTSADKIRQIALKGFDFQVLAENLSQTVQAKRGIPKWYRGADMEPEVASHVKKMNIGEVSDVIKTKSGYKIVCLMDVAEAGKIARSEATYRFMKGTVVYKDKFFTQKDNEKIEKMIESILKLENVGDLKKYCLINDIKLTEENVTHPNPYYADMIQRSKSSGKPIIMQSVEEPDKLNIVMFVSETAGNAQVPSDPELREMISAEKMEKTFARNFKKLKSVMHISRNTENIKRMTE